MTSKVKMGDLHQETKSKKVVKDKCAVGGSQRKRDWPKWDLACVGLTLSRTGLRGSWPSSASFNKVCFPISTKIFQHSTDQVFDSLAFSSHLTPVTKKPLESLHIECVEKPSMLFSSAVRDQTRLVQAGNLPALQYRLPRFHCCPVSAPFLT